MTHKSPGTTSSLRGPTEPALSALGWGRLRRAVSVGVFGVATVLAVVVGSQGAMTSPVAPVTPVVDAAAAVGPAVAAARDADTRPDRTAGPADRGHGRQHR